MGASGGGLKRAREMRGAIVYCTHGIADPLVAPLMLDYLVRLQQEAAFARVLLFTEEPPGAQVPPWADALLRAARIDWRPARYDVRGRQWLQRGRNLAGMLWHALRFRLKHGHCWQVGYLSFGGAYAMAASFLGLGPCAVVCFEPHSRYMIELGIWRPGSLKARIVGWTERWQMRRAAAVIAPTTAVRSHVQAHHPRGRVALQAITIDAAKSAFDEAARIALRRRLGIADEAWVVAYVGKFGGIYHSIAQYLAFIAALAEADDALRFVIITQAEVKARIGAHPLAAALAGRLDVLPPVPPEALHQHLSLADAGVVAIPPAPGQAYRTPVKTAHYWAAGLPIIIPRGVSDDHRIAVAEDTGVAVRDLVPEAAPEIIAAFQRWQAEGRAAVRGRCMRSAMAHRDTGAMLRVLRDLLLEQG